MSAATLETITPVLNLTPAAIKQVKFLIGKRGNPNLGLRVGVKGGGCSGLSYVTRLEETPDEDDLVLSFDGLTVMVDPKSARFISGLVLDYSTANLLEGGWKFTNPNAQKSCGCGTSFTPK